MGRAGRDNNTAQASPQVGIKCGDVSPHAEHHLGDRGDMFVAIGQRCILDVGASHTAGSLKRQKARESGSSNDSDLIPFGLFVTPACPGSCSELGKA